LKDETGLAANGRPRCDAAGDARAYAVNPPVERASTILFPTYADFLEGSAQVRYGRFGASTHRALERSIAALEGGHSTRLAPSGLQAIAAAMLAFVKAGDHVLIADCVYDPTRTFADALLSRFGVDVEYFAPSIGAGLAALIRASTTVVLTESPGSLTFEVQDLPAIARAADSAGAILVADNTWSGGLYHKPIALGAKVSVQAATKYLSGHSDVMLGAITSADEPIARRIYDSLSQIGAAVSPDDVYLAHRGLRTLAVRLERCGETGLELAAWLAARPEVVRVLHPALPSHPGHALWRRDFTGAPGLFSIVLKPAPEAAIAAFFDALQLFGIGFSWGGYESLAVRVRPERARTIEPWTETGAVIRLHAGLEDADDLIADLERAFAAMASADRV
jgi:cystathionine beta-lyase